MQSKMSLLNGKPNKTYIIENVILEENLLRRLESLGVIEGTRIRIITKSHLGAMVIKLRGTRFALGKYITSNIEVKELENE